MTASTGRTKRDLRELIHSIRAELDREGFRIGPETKFPAEASTSLIIDADRPAPLTLRLRIPEWTGSSASAKINGKPLDVSSEGGGYLLISRTWKRGGRVDGSLPMPLRIESMADGKHMRGVLYDPVVLAGDLASDGLTEDLIVGSNAPRLQRLPINVPSFRAATADPNSWIKPDSSLMSFRTTGPMLHWCR